MEGAIRQSNAFVTTNRATRKNSRKRIEPIRIGGRFPLSAHLVPVPSDNRILFFDRDREVFGFLSNYYEAPITIDGESWRSTEFYYQAQKSLDPDYRQAIRNAKNSDHAKGIGSDPRRSRKSRKRSWFVGRIEAFRSDWHEIKLNVMARAVQAKFSQHPQLQAMLLATFEAEIVEDSTHDPFWGMGRDGRGENWMGRLLMKLRQEMRDSSTPVPNTFSAG